MFIRVRRGSIASMALRFDGSPKKATTIRVGIISDRIPLWSLSHYNIITPPPPDNPILNMKAPI